MKEYENYDHDKLVQSIKNYDLDNHFNFKDGNKKFHADLNNFNTCLPKL